MPPSHIPIYLLIITLSLFMATTLCSLTDVVLGQQYEGQYTSLMNGKQFDYLQSHSGRIIAIFYGSPNRQTLNSLQIFMMDPTYQDGRVVLVQIKSIIIIDESSGQWNNPNHQLSYTTIWHEREQDTFDVNTCSTNITLQNLSTQDYQKITVKLYIKCNNFQFTADLKYYDQLISTMAYSLFVTGMIAIQIFSAYKILQIMDAPNFVFAGKLSLLTLSLCNIQDFSQTMTHIQYIMSSQSGYLFFIFPALAYIVLFIIFDMKMLFLVWRSQNLRNMQNPQLLRKKLTAFYIQFYLGLFLYLTLTYFFADDQWMILLRNLILIPQIAHNIRMGSNPGFNSYFILGFIGSRLFIPFYERACPQNRFKLTPNSYLVVALFAIYALETVILLLQYRLGSRFFVPKRFLPNYYNYRQKVKKSEENKEQQCTICLQSIFQADISQVASHGLNDSGVDQQLLGEATVMCTPCNHKFHGQCLTHWMQVKLECPTCRATLPPL